MISKTAQNAELSRVSYAYDSFDNMTEILRGDGMKYVLAYDAFHKLQSIGIDGKNEPLAAYTYKKGSGRLKSITYANGDRMEATYNAAGQMTAERWYDGSNTLKKRYAYLYDGQGNLVRSLDFTEEKEYIYEDGRIVRGAECSVTFGANDVVLAKDVLNTVRYFYDNDGKLTKKVVTPKNGDPFTVWYESPEKENSVEL